MNFTSIITDIVEKEKFQSLKNDPHHGITRYDHVMRVARNTYRVSKKLNIDYISATRGALLHDYFNNNEYKMTKGLKKGSIHPVISLNNARREFVLNPKEENIIVSHMFPLGNIKPNCKESWIVTIIDKVVAIYECCAYKLREKIIIAFSFIVNMTRI